MESQRTVPVITFVVLIMSLVLHHSAASFNHTCVPGDFFPEAPRRGICGRRLARTLDALCRHHANPSQTTTNGISQLLTVSTINYFNQLSYSYKMVKCCLCVWVLLAGTNGNRDLYFLHTQTYYEP